MLHSIRSLIFFLEAASILLPLLKRKKDSLKIASFLNQMALLVMSNSDLIWKFLKKQHYMIENIRKIFKFVRRSK